VPAVSIRIFCRRRAERFAQLLDEANGGRRHHVRSTYDEELTGLVALGKRVSSTVPTTDPDSDFRSSLRAMLVATAEREGIGSTAVPAAETGGRTARAGRRGTTPVSPTVRGKQRRARARRCVVVGVAAGAIAVSGMSAASESALPGDALYGMKRSTERAQLALTSSELSKGQLFLEFARTRLAEAEAVRGDTVGFAAVLDDMDADTSQGIKLLATSAAQRRDPMALDTIDAFQTAQHRQVSALLRGATSAERARVAKSLTLLDSIQARADGLRAALLCGADPLANPGDALGPQPRPCMTTRIGGAGTPVTIPSARPDGIRPPEAPRAERNQPSEPATSPSDDRGANLRTKPEDVTGSEKDKNTD
jgi:hypothetical protein